MEKLKRNDLVIDGVGYSSGGHFNNVIIGGEGKINGDTDCNNLEINGIGEIKGSVKTQVGRIDGKGKIFGALKSNSFLFRGITTIEGSVHINEIEVEGIIYINGNVDSDTFNNQGSITIKNDCNAEIFISNGEFKIGGLLNGGNININLYASCTVKEIGGEVIKVKKGNSFNLLEYIKSVIPLMDINSRLRCDMIEGDEIYLEYTKAKVVRGNNVILGEGCEIQLVEYRSSFEMSDKSVVSSMTKLV